MARTVPRALLTGLLCVTVGALAAGCGSSGDPSDTTAGRDGGKRGGTLRVLSEEDVSPLDPGITYSSAAFNVLSATVRPLYRYTPDDPTTIKPDLAAGPPRISADGRTLTVRIRSGVRFGPPVNREVTSADVKYAIERGFHPSVLNPYASTYFGDIVGADAARGGPIRGIRTPDAQTIVFKLTRPTARLLAQATTLPLTAPVPPEYARRFDAKPKGEMSDYGNWQVATGPYRFAADARGKALGKGIVPGRRVVLVRNPNWDPETDSRPAYLDRIEWSIGTEPNVAGRQVLEGRGMTLADTPTAAIVKRAVERHADQIFFSPGAGSRYAALNTAIPPFDDPNLRKAVAAQLDREQMRRVRGGEAIGDIATHFLYPGVAGFEEAGGHEGPPLDFLADPSGNPGLARRYLARAGYPGGRYTGTETIEVVGLAGDPADKDAQIFEEALKALGFRTRLRLVDANVMYARFCAAPRARVHACPNLGWIRDFADPQTVLDAAFNGDAISLEGNNSNWPQLNDPRINAAMDRAELLVDEQERARAWAKIDRMITATAAAIPWLWDKQPVISSADVRCVHQLWNQGHCDLAHSSLR